MAWLVKIFVVCFIFGYTGVIAQDFDTNDECDTSECLISAFQIGYYMNSSVDPCDDFHEFVCGRVGKKPSIAGKYEILYSDAYYKIKMRLKNIIEEIDEKSAPKPFKLAKILYQNCLDNGFESYEDYTTQYYDMLSQPSGWPVIAGEQWQNSTVTNYDIISALLFVQIQADTLNSSRGIPWVKQSIGVIDPAILRMGVENEIVKAYYDYMVDIAVIIGASRSTAEAELKDVVLTEITLANDTLSELTRRIDHLKYNRTTVGEFTSKYPYMRRFIYVQVPPSYRLNDNDVIMVPKAFANVDKVLSRTSKRTLANLIKWYKVQTQSVAFAPLRSRSIEFDNLLGRSYRPKETWEKCIEMVNDRLGLSLRVLYQKKFIDENIIGDINQMVTLIRQTIREIVDKAEWLDSATKREALLKVDNVIGHVAFRDEYKNETKLEEFYRDLELSKGDVSQSVTNISVFLSNHYRGKSRYLPNKNDWTTSGDILASDASYDSSFNTYIVPAVYALSDYYDVYRAKYLNYATLGSIVAHEMAHSLDASSIFFDSNGNLREWLSPESKEKFEQRVQCLIEQYGNYTVDKLGLKIRAHPTLDENIADNLGINAAYRAYIKWRKQNKKELLLPGLSYTRKQLFWIALASASCKDYKNLELMSVVLSSHHSPFKYRINGALANRPQFAKDFNCNRGTRMNPVKKCSI